MLLFLLELFPESRPRIVSKIFRAKCWRPFYLPQLRIQFGKNFENWCNWPILYFFFKLRCLAKHSNRHLIFSNIEEPYDKLPKQLNSAITKLFYCFSWGVGRGRGLAEHGRNTKIVKISLFFWFLNLHNLLERVYPFKFQNTLNYFLMHQKKKKKKKKLAKVENHIFFKKLTSQKSMCDYLKILKTE